MRSHARMFLDREGMQLDIMYGSLVQFEIHYLKELVFAASNEGYLRIYRVSIRASRLQLL